MIIEKLWTVKLCKISRGQVFEFDGNLYMRITDYYDVNAVALKTGCLFNIDIEQEVTLYDNAKVVLI